MSNTLERRKKLFEQHPYCFWCDTELTLELRKENTATIDHLRSRLHPLKRVNGGVRTVLACSECNQTRAAPYDNCDCDERFKFYYEDDFYLVWRQDTSALTRTHISYQAAKDEADRLSKKYPNEKIFILKKHGVVVNEAAQVNQERRNVRV